MNWESSQENPYSPPAITRMSEAVATESLVTSKPIIPAVIGCFTYGSCSPYALVLCLEHYRSLGVSRTSFPTHIATLLSCVGTIAWMALSYMVAADHFEGRSGPQYASLVIGIWSANVIFLLWAYWRLRVFRGRPTRYAM